MTTPKVTIRTAYGNQLQLFLRKRKGVCDRTGQTHTPCDLAGAVVVRGEPAAIDAFHAAGYTLPVDLQAEQYVARTYWLTRTDLQLLDTLRREREPRSAAIRRLIREAAVLR